VVKIVFLQLNAAFVVTILNLISCVRLALNGQTCTKYY